MIRLLVLWPICWLLSLCNLYSQPLGEFQLLIGTSTYLGDLEEEDYLSAFQSRLSNFGIHYAKPLRWGTAIQMGVNIMTLQGDETDNANAQRGFSFESSLGELSLGLLWEPFAKKRFPPQGGYKNIVSPYLKAGLVYSYFDTTTDYGNFGIDAVPAKIQQDINNSDQWTWALPIGGGFRLDISEHSSLGVEVVARKAFTDYLDGVSFSGNPNQDDWYIGLGATYVYRWHKPDYDRDGWMDNLDRCPQAGGLDRFEGCPDSDGDLIPDIEDACPYVAGTAMGCPDADYDGVPDMADKCPDYPGMPGADGCLDSDGDGFSDDNDLCPNCPGMANMQGCPDADGDGVMDALDKCPHLAGLGASGGCPFEDADQDGVDDDEDRCPTEAGTTLAFGCPDADSDGIPDLEDKCPNIQGGLASRGCPDVSPELRAQLALLTKAVQFETGSNALKASSKERLSDLVHILTDYPYYNLTIDGHTDDRGNDAANLRLSQSRAKACHDFLVQAGIAAGRLQFQGFGEQKPLTTNATPEGRQINRRVEFTLYVGQ